MDTGKPKGPCQRYFVGYCVINFTMGAKRGAGWANTVPIFVFLFLYKERGVYWEGVLRQNSERNGAVIVLKCWCSLKAVRSVVGPPLQLQ